MKQQKIQTNFSEIWTLFKYKDNKERFKESDKQIKVTEPNINKLAGTWGEFALVDIFNDRGIDNQELIIHDNIDENEWLKATANNAIFNYLNDPKEDIYTINDGKEFYDKK